MCVLHLCVCAPSVCARLLTESLTHSLTHSLTRLPTHSMCMCCAARPKLRKKASKTECAGTETSSKEVSVEACASKCTTEYFAFGRQSGRCSGSTCTCLCETVGKDCKQVSHPHYDLYKNCKIFMPTTNMPTNMPTRAPTIEPTTPAPTNSPTTGTPTDAPTPSPIPPTPVPTPEQFHISPGDLCDGEPIPASECHYAVFAAIPFPRKPLMNSKGLMSYHSIYNSKAPSGCTVANNAIAPYSATSLLIEPRTRWNATKVCQGRELHNHVHQNRGFPTLGIVN